MDAQLLEAALGGQVELSAAVGWALGEGGEPPALPPRPGSPWRSPSGPAPPLRPADFRVHVLNCVREQAELVLAAAEQEAGGGATGSQPPTPQPPGRAGGGTGAAGGQQPAPPALQQPRQRRASGGGSGGGSGAPEQRAAAARQQQQQQLPGKLDDDDAFPTLAASAASSGGRRGGRASPSKGQPGGPRQQQQHQQQQQAPSQRQGGSGKRRTIVPAKVATLEVNPLFQAPQPQAKEDASAPEQQPQQQPQQQQQQEEEEQQQQPQPAAASASQPPPSAAAMALPMSPPPVAVRLPAPGAVLAASLLARGGSGAVGSPAAVGSPGGEGGTPKRITPIRLSQPAEVQQTFLASLPATSPRAARQAMLQQPEFLARSRPGSRLGTPLAGALAAAANAFSLEAAATAVAAARQSGASAGSSGGGAPGASGGSSRSPLLWSEEAQSVCQQLSFDTLLSPPRPAAAAEAAAAPQAGGSGKKAAPSGASSAGTVELAAHAGPGPAAPGTAAAAPDLTPLERRVQRLEMGGSTSAGFDAGASSQVQHSLGAALQRRAPAGGATSSGFDAPASCFGGGAAAGGSGSSGGASAAQPAVPPAAPSAAQPAVPPAAPSAQQPAPAAAPFAAEAAPEEGPVLCAEGRRLAQLHAALLRCSSSISLSAELDLLLNLLAVPSTVRIDPALTGVTRLWCGLLAQQYACCVLQAAGGLIRGLGPQLLADLSALPLVRSAFPRLHGEMQAALQHFASTQLHTEKAYHQVRAAGGILSLHGLAALTSDGRRTRSQEEQRRISNREACRDEWFALMKEAAAQTHSFAARQLGRLAAGGASDRLSESGRTAATHAGDEASLLHVMQHSATDLLRRLRPDNFAAFAELFTAAVLQAAATGETLLDEELSSLARKNVGRFHSLNQRMQAQGAAGPSRGGAARLQSNQPVTATGFGRQGSSSTQGRWASGGGGASGGRGQPPRGASGRGGAGADEAVAESLRLVAEFPRPQRLYVLFLEAADSHRLNSHLARCMTGKLRALAAGEHGGAAGLSERVAALSTLAAFLSYLTFTRAGYTGPAGEAPASVAYDSSHPIDAAAALEAAAAGDEGGPLVWTLPWVLRYLWFLRWDAQAAGAPYFRQLLARLTALHAAPELQPRAPRFCLAAFTLRSVLDDFAERMGPDLMPPCPAGAPGSTALGGGSGGGPGAAVPALACLAAVDGQLDSRFLHLCCPSLEHARQLFSAAGGAGGRAQQARRVKKIRPTAPSGAVARAAAAAPAAAAPPGDADAARSLLRLQLQRAFLEQYSTDEHRVKLREVVDFVSDILAFNCATSAADALLPPAGDAIAAALREAAAALVAEGQRQAGGTGGEAAPAPAPASPPQPGPPPLDPSVRLYLEALAEQLIAEHSTAVLAAAQAQAEAAIRGGAVQALAALTAPERGAAVIGTAAAVAAEAAAAAADQRLRALVPSAVRRAATDHLQHVLVAAARGMREAAAQPGAPSPGGAERAAAALPPAETSSLHDAAAAE